METTRRLTKNGNLHPAPFSLLADLPAGAVKHVQHGLRPPGGIYNVSTARVLQAFVAVLDQLDELGRAPGGLDAPPAFDATRLLSAQVELLEAMLSHIDDGYQILKACHPPDATIDEHFADRWLETARHPSVRQFKNAVRSYRDALAPLVNRVKHEHGRLRFLVFHDETERIGGYCLEGVNPDGSLGPDPVIHRGDTAYSFNRDLRFHFVHLFEIGNELSGALKVALRAQRVPLTGRVVSDPSTVLIGVAERVAALGSTVFPDEVTKPTPQVRVERDGSDVSLTIHYPSLAVFRPTRNGMRVMTTFQGDGYTNSFRMPYFPKQPPS